MAAIVGPNGRVARQRVYEREDEFERDVVRLADYIFGPSLYIDIKRRVGNDIVTIPDGYLVDTADPAIPRLFVVENEIVGHDPFKHIGIQMLKFVTSFDDAQRAVRTFLMENIRKTTRHQERLETACKKSSSPNIDDYLDRAVYGEFRGLVVIDEARPELYRVLEKINANISVLEVKAFETDSGERFHLFDTLYDDDEEETPELVSPMPLRSPVERAARRLRRASCDTIIVPARSDGFQDVFLAQNQWYAIRIGAGMKDRIKQIAAYQVAPISAVTHIAEIAEIKPYKDTGKYVVIFKGPAEEIRHVPIRQGSNGPQGPVYAQKSRLLAGGTLEDVLTQ
jgi:hypothetical protein